MSIVLSQIDGDPQVADEINSQFEEAEDYLTQPEEASDSDGKKKKKKPSKVKKAIAEAMRDERGTVIDSDNEAGRLSFQWLLQRYSLGGKYILKCFRGQFYHYKKTHWIKRDEDELYDDLALFIMDNAKQKRTVGLVAITWIFARARARLSSEVELNSWLVKPEEMSDNIICLKNGLLDLDNLSAGMRPHTPDWFSTNCLPFNYQPEAACPQWLQFVADSFGGDVDRAALLQEWFGYCLTANTSLNKLMVFEGPPRAGKGVTADVQRHLLGKDNVADVRLEMFDDRFQLSNTVGKLLNVSDETDQIQKVAEAKLKALTGSTASFFWDQKGVKGFQSPVTARFLIISNNGLPIHDRSMALVSRILHLQFDKSHVDAEDSTLRDRLYAEASGIFNWALEGYKRVTRQARFITPKHSAQIIMQYKESANPFKVWWEEFTEVTSNPADFLIKRLVTTRHNTWLERGGYNKIADNTSARQVRMLVPGIQEGRPYAQDVDDPEIIRQQPAWLGVRWKD